MLWRLQKALYGLRRAPALFQAHLRSVLISLKFVPSVGEPCLFTHKGMGITLPVHVDDMLLTGEREAVTTMAAWIGELMSLKVVGFISDQTWTKFLGRKTVMKGDRDGACGFQRLSSQACLKLLGSAMPRRVELRGPMPPALGPKISNFLQRKITPSSEALWGSSNGARMKGQTFCCP